MITRKRLQLGLYSDCYRLSLVDNRYYVHCGMKELYSTLSYTRFMAYVSMYLPHGFRLMSEILESASFPDPALENPDYADGRQYAVSSAYGDTDTSSADRFDSFSKLS